MIASNLFGLNFLQPTADGNSTQIVGDYDPQSQTWGGIVTASAGGCANECFNCCANNTGTALNTVEDTNYTTYGGTDVVTNNPGGGTDCATDDCRDSTLDADWLGD